MGADHLEAMKAATSMHDIWMVHVGAEKAQGTVGSSISESYCALGNLCGELRSR
jgi:hypothetical protein